jgi:succinyl-diaminopimelate desuccinylase
MINLTETLAWLCQMPSPTGEEGPIADAVSSWLQHNARESRIRRYNNSIVCELGSSGPHIVLAGHLDTVRTVHDGPVRLEGARLYGCGASDMKAGLALMLGIAQDNPCSQGMHITLVFYGAEEGPYVANELETVLEKEPMLSKADFALCLEPTDNALQLGCAGTLHAQVTIRGNSAHSARPWEGENAIHKAGSLIGRLARLEPVWKDISGLRFAQVTHATLISGGRGRNVIPDCIELNVNHRFLPGIGPQEAKAQLESIVNDDGEIRFVDLAPSALPFRDNPFVQLLVDAGVRAVEAKQAWTDVARLASRGIAAANFGPGLQTQAHQRNEWASVSLLEQANLVLRSWLVASEKYSLSRR